MCAFVIDSFDFAVCSFAIYSYTVDFDLKKLVDEDALKLEKRPEVRKEIKKVFEERYLHQTGKSEKKASGVQYLFKRLRF